MDNEIPNKFCKFCCDRQEETRLAVAKAADLEAILRKIVLGLDTEKNLNFLVAIIQETREAIGS